MKKFAYTLLIAAAPVVAMAANANDTVVIKPEPIIAKGIILPEPLMKTPSHKKAAPAKVVQVQPAAGASIITTPPPPPPPETTSKMDEKPAAKTATAKTTPAKTTAAKKVEVKKSEVAAKKTEVKANTKAEAKKAEAKKAAKKETKTIAPYSAATDDPKIKELNKKYLIDFLKAAKSEDVGSFYRANPQFAHSLTEEQFVNKFSQYSALDDDTAAIGTDDFSATTINKVDGNQRYHSCQLLEAESKVKIQIVQDAHKYTISNKYCKVSDGFKLVSFKFTYDQ